MPSSFLFIIFINYITYSLIVLNTHILSYEFLYTKLQYFSYSLAIQWFPKNICCPIFPITLTINKTTLPFILALIDSYYQIFQSQISLQLISIPIPISSLVDILSNSQLILHTPNWFSLIHIPYSQTKPNPNILNIC